MINNHNVSVYSGKTPNHGSSRFIIGGSIYGKQQVSELCTKQTISLWTKESILDARNLNLGIPEIAQLINKALNEGKYENSQWCQSKNSGSWAACDSYAISISRFMLPECKEIVVTLYFKFAISRTGAALLVISNHREGS